MLLIFNYVIRNYECHAYMTLDDFESKKANTYDSLSLVSAFYTGIFFDILDMKKFFYNCNNI